MAVREDVVEAHVAVFDELPGRAPTDPAQFAREALSRAWRPGDDRDNLFDRLTPAEVEHLRATLPYLPTLAARYFAERFIIPPH